MQSSNLLVVLSLISLTECMDYGLKWGEQCKIPGPNDYLKPFEECEMSKGLQCQVYRQGSFCGCLIRSSLSWDERAGECRRKPGHHCPYINSTDARAYESLSYHLKCHVTAECVLIEPIPEVEATEAKKTKGGKPEQFSVCKCRPGYKENRDGLVCYDLNSASIITCNLVLTLALSWLVTT